MSNAKRKIRFVQGREVKDHTGAVIERFKAGQVFAVGDAKGEMGEGSARHWLHRGIAVEVDTAPPRREAPTPETQRPEGDDLIADIVSKIDTLDEHEDFTGGGVPSVPALTRALGYEISGKERDAAWARYQEDAAPAAGSDKDGELNV